jgi:gliding motility-associated-like protein
MLLERCFDEGVLNLTDQLIGASSLAGTWYVNGAEVAGLVDLASSPGGVYTYQLDPLGPCPASESYLDLYIDQGVVFEAGFDASACSGSAVVELGQPPVGNLIYQWEPATNLSDITISNPEVNFENLTNELTEIDYVATVSNGICTIQDTVSVTIYPLPEPNLGPDLAICRWDEVDLFTGADGDHIWSPAFLFSDPNADLQALEIINDLAIGVQVTNEFGCVAADDMIISMLERPTGDFDVNPIEGCAPLVVEVENLSDNSMPVEYFWTLSNGTTSTDISPTFTFYAEGQHDISLLTVADNGCSSLQEATTFITVHPTPFASFYTVSEELSVLHSNLDVHNTSLGGYEYNWSINGLLASTDFEPTLFLPEVPDQDYWICLETINEFGCSDSTCHPVHVVGEFTLYAPNAFTPDQDGINEAFQVYVAGADMSTFELSIYNRWGEQLFISTNPNEPWYGNTFGGDYFVPNGVYVWQVRIQSLYSAELITERGTVTLIR